jgi:putative addiction module component (TIGR02574 family)
MRCSFELEVEEQPSTPREARKLRAKLSPGAGWEQRRLWVLGWLGFQGAALIQGCKGLNGSYFFLMAAVIDINSVLQSVLSLPRPERSYLAERLLFSLDDDAEISAAWRAELDARVQRRELGETRSYSREEVSGDMEAILA